jgi:hypothetical protein
MKQSLITYKKNPKNLPLKLCTDHSVHLLRMIPLFNALYRRKEKRVAFSRLLINIKLFTFSIFVGHFRPTGSGSSRPKSMRIHAHLLANIFPYYRKRKEKEKQFSLFHCFLYVCYSAKNDKVTGGGGRALDIKK